MHRRAPSASTGPKWYSDGSCGGSVTTHLQYRYVNGWYGTDMNKPDGRDGPEYWAAQRLRELRTGRGWTQAEVVKRLRAFGYEWSQATMTRFEAATRPTSLNELAALSALYGLPLADFLAGAPAREPDCRTCGESGPEPGYTSNTCGRSGS